MLKLILFFGIFAFFVQTGLSSSELPPYECNPTIHRDCIDSPNPLPECNRTYCTIDGYIAVEYRAPAERNWMVCKTYISHHKCDTPGALLDLSEYSHLLYQPIDFQGQQMQNITQEDTAQQIPFTPPPPSILQQNGTTPPTQSLHQPSQIEILDIFNNIRCFPTSKNPCCFASQKINFIWKRDFPYCSNVSCYDEYEGTAKVCFHECLKMYIEGRVIFNETITQCIPLIIDKSPEAMKIQWIENKIHNITITTIDLQQKQSVLHEKESADTILRDALIGIFILVVCSYVIFKFLFKPKKKYIEDF